MAIGKLTAAWNTSLLSACSDPCAVFLPLSCSSTLTVTCACSGPGVECALVEELSRRSRFSRTLQRKWRSPASQPPKRTDVRQGKYQRETIVWTWILYLQIVSWLGTAAELWHISPLLPLVTVCLINYLTEGYTQDANIPHGGKKSLLRRSGKAEWQKLHQWKLQLRPDQSHLHLLCADWNVWMLNGHLKLHLLWIHRLSFLDLQLRDWKL